MIDRPAVRTWLTYAPGVLAFAVLAAISLTSLRGLVVFRYFHDTFVILDAMWRATLGQTPHIDFPSPIGQAYYWPFRVLAAAGDSSITTILRANVLVAATTVALACVTLPRRLSPLLFGIAVVTAATVAMTPRDLDGGIQSFSFLAPYNTWAWALVTLPALIALLPSRAPQRPVSLVVDGVVLGLVLGLLFYLKITFFLPALAFVIAGLVLRHLPLSTAFAAALAFVALGLAVELSAHNTVAYLEDIRAVAQANIEGDRGARIAKVVKSFTLATGCGLVFLAALWLWAPSRRLGSWAVSWWRTILVVAVILGGGALVASQNHPRVQLTLIAIGLIAGAELAMRRLATLGPGLRFPLQRPREALAWALVIAVAVPAPLLDGAAIVAQALASRSDRVCGIPAMRGVADGFLVRRLSAVDDRRNGATGCEWIAASSAKPYLRPGLNTWEARSIAEVQQLEAGVRLLAVHRQAEDVILAAAFSNPFPMIFRSPPPEGAAIWWDYGRDYSATSHPPAARMLASTTLVLQAHDHRAGRLFWQVYGREIEERFQVVAETPGWRLWRRTADSAAAASPVAAAR